MTTIVTAAELRRDAQEFLRLKRQALKLTPWDPNRYGQSGDARVLAALAV